jgi:hypothetical protein
MKRYPGIPESLVRPLRSLKTLLMLRQRTARARRSWTGRDAGLADIIAARVKHFPAIRAPMVLVSQVQRSGGTLMGQLFDGHPQCWAHPHEVKIGYPQKWDWPRIDLSSKPERWLEILFENSSIDQLKHGYGKDRGASHPFLTLPALQRALFLHHAEGARTERDVFDAYMTSYFGAWLDYQGNPDGKRVVTGFAAALGTSAHNVDEFFRIYPDGHLISVVRDPFNWYPSARRLRSKASWFGTLESAVGWWERSVRAMLYARTHYPERVLILSFRELITDMPGTMRLVAERIGIEFDDVLCTPTFNGRPVMAANSSFKRQKEGGIRKDVLSRADQLSAEERAYIESRVGALYAEMEALASA